MKKCSSRATSVACLIGLLIQTGCVTVTRPPNVSESQRSRLGTVGIVSVNTPPNGDLDLWARGTGEGVAKGAGNGALQGAGILGQCGSNCGVGLLLLPFFAAGGAVYGAVAGVSRSVSEDKAKQIETRLRAVLLEAGPPQRLRSEIVKAASKSGVNAIREITDEEMAEGEPLDYRPLSDRGVDTVLELRAVSFVLTGDGGDDPTLTFRTTIASRLVDVKTNSEISPSRTFTYAMGRGKFSEWDSDDARRLRDVVARAYQSIAQSVVDEMFLVVRTN